MIFRKRSKSASTPQDIWKAGVWIFRWPGRFDSINFNSNNLFTHLHFVSISISMTWPSRSDPLCFQFVNYFPITYYSKYFGDRVMFVCFLTFILFLQYQFQWHDRVCLLVFVFHFFNCFPITYLSKYFGDRVCLFVCSSCMLQFSLSHYIIFYVCFFAHLHFDST